MLLTIFGLILIAIPFLLVFCFKNRVNGFAVVLSSVLALHLIVAFVTQFFHIFFYPVLIIIHSIVALSVLAVIKFKFKNTSFKFKINWLVVVGFLIIFFQLWSVHFSFSGIINTVSGPDLVFKNSYPYPYFSDEWVGVSLTNYSISNNSLPTINPLAISFNVKNFTNIFICFFATLSEIFLLLSLAPLTGYVFLSITSGVLVCLLIFLFLRANKVNAFISLLAALCVPYIVNSANLPGIWYLIPFTGGVILFLVSLINISCNNRWFFWLSSLLSILFYPPLVIFIFPVFITNLLLDSNSNKKTKIKIILSGVSVVFLAALLIIYGQQNNTKLLKEFIFISFWHLNLDGGIPAFYFWRVLPVVILPFSIIGLLGVFNKKYLPLATAVIIGLFFWIFYSFSEYYFFIDYARVVVLTSFLLIILAGIGANWLFNFLTEKYQPTFNKNFILVIKICILILFLVFSFAYTNRLNWQDLKLKISGAGISISPAPPANIYLTADDLRLFKSISKARFLSIPWKGLVIGVATNNYPFSSKQSIISNTFLNYNDFINKSCEDKVAISKTKEIEYVYSSAFICNQFVEQGRSKEGFVLYKFNN